MDANGLEGTPDSDEDGQIKMLVATAKSSFNNHYLSEAKAEITTVCMILGMKPATRKWPQSHGWPDGKGQIGHPVMRITENR